MPQFKYFAMLCLLLLHSRTIMALVPANTNTPSAFLFQENKGQFHDQNFAPVNDLKFLASLNGNEIVFLKTGFSYQIGRVNSWKESDLGVKDGIKHKVPDVYEKYRVDLNWVNANPNAKPKGENAAEEYSNYYFPSCPDGALNVKSYSKLFYTSIYNGVDVVWYTKNGVIEYDYRVAAGIDYKQIKMQIKGASAIEITKEGDLLISTPLGDIIEGKPLVKQGNRVLKAGWVIKNAIVSFEIEGLDSREPYIIDPIVRVWGTYYPAGASSICVSNIKGEIYTTGSSSSSSLIATTGAFQVSLTGSYAGTITKFSADGVRLWGTYYGSNNESFAGPCAIDNKGDLYVCGETSADVQFPVSSAAHQATYGGGYRDGFILKFNPSGYRIFGTLYGGNKEDAILKCSVNKFGHLVICGHTLSSNGTSIATSGAHQPSMVVNDNYIDAFIAKFDSTGQRFWGTYYGGMGYDRGSSCAIDSLDNAYLIGYTDTPTGPEFASTGVYQNYNAGIYDGYIAKFGTNGQRLWGTYFGGTGQDLFYHMVLDRYNNIFISGFSNSYSNITTPGAFQASPAMGLGSILIKFSENGARIWGTYFSQGSISKFVTTDQYGNIYMIGEAAFGGTQNYTTPGAHQTVYGGGNVDAYLAKFSNQGYLRWCTYYGGNDSDLGYACTVDTAMNVYLSGGTLSLNDTAISTPGSHQQLPMGFNGHSFLVKFKDTDDKFLGIGDGVFLNEYVMVYPNPSNGVYKYKLSNSQSCILNIYNDSGKLIKTDNLLAQQGTFNLLGLASGIYYVQFLDDNTSRVIFNTKLIKN